MPLYPSKVLRAKERASTPYSSIVFSLGLTPSTSGECVSHPKTKHTTMQKLFVQLNVLINPMKHWYDGVGWEMVDCMCEQVLKVTMQTT